MVVVTYLKVHQMLMHIVFNQKKAARKKKCITVAEKQKARGLNYSQSTVNSIQENYKGSITH